ncbi:hypothetical protein HK104_008923 [Borealophlyctis nickersoniae]|nr:hypothetical protein HK104_008923 [Borealophlyctis nickersoniae]
MASIKAETASIKAEMASMKAEIASIKAETASMKAETAKLKAANARLLAPYKVLPALIKKFWWCLPLLVLWLAIYNGLPQLPPPEWQEKQGPRFDWLQFFKTIQTLLSLGLVGLLGMAHLHIWVREVENLIREPSEPRPERTESSALALPAPPPAYAA